MSLEEKLASVRAQVATMVPPEKQQIMHRATANLRASGIMDRILPIGAPAPAFELTNHDGRRVASSDLLEGGPTLLSFFRGSW